MQTTETTVSDARRVYISLVKESVTTENKYVEHLKYDKKLIHNNQLVKYI